MSVKNLMEDKQLDFHQPLLSVRRFSPTAGSEKDVKRKTDNSLPNVPPLPYYKSELKSGPISNPGTVPFRWEQSPGRPRDKSKPESQALERPPAIPKLPPGRNVKAKQKAPEKSSFCSQSVSSVEANTTRFESSKDSMEGESSDSGNGDESYQDAFDSVSRTDSFFLNCSVSGELDVPEMKPSGTFSNDPQTHDFMMSRFLPAAKAMASETPKHAPRKQPVAQEQPRQLRQVLSGDKRPPLYLSRPNALPNCAKDNREEVSDVKDDDYDGSGKVSTTVCGLLNPTPIMSVRTRVPISPVNSRQARSSSTSSCQQIENEHLRVATHEQRSIVGLEKTEQYECKNLVRNKSNHVPNRSSFQKLKGSSLYGCTLFNGMSPEQNELPQSRFYEEKGILYIPKEAEIDEGNGFSSQKRCTNSFQEILANQAPDNNSGSASPTVEKMLYVDSEHKVVSPKLSSQSSDTKGLHSSLFDYLEIIEEFCGLEETPSADPLLKDIARANVMDGEVTLQSQSLKSVDCNILTFFGKSDHQLGMEMVKGFRQDQDIFQESITSANFKFTSHGNMDFEDQHQLTEMRKGENSRELGSQFHVPPPLPKSPSESWLSRTLPSISSRLPSPFSYFGTSTNSRHQASKTPCVDPKWDTIVKTTKTHHQQLQFSKELTSIPED